MVDVAVIGAGPAGAVCAHGLSKKGLDVALIDRVRPQRYKTCGGGLVQRALRLLDLDLQDVTDRQCMQAQVNLIDCDLSFELRASSPVVTTTMRAAFDHLLVRAAEEAGAALVAPCNLRDLATTPRAVEIHTSAGRLRARYCVAADGAASRTARAAGWLDNEFLCPALESEIRVSPADYERFGSWARFDIGLPTRGYAWVFPKKNHLSVGCMCRERGWSTLREDLDTYLSHLGLLEHGAREDHGYVIPLAPRSSTLARGRVLLVGDAAGFADPVTCEGISYAVLSGQLAANAIADNLADPQAAARAYENLLEDELLPELRTASKLARLLYEHPRLRRLAFRRMGQSLCELVGRVFSGEVTYRSLLRRPGNYFKLVAKLATGS